MVYILTNGEEFTGFDILFMVVDFTGSKIKPEMIF
jgi:hypothetical protein